MKLAPDHRLASADDLRARLLSVWRQQARIRDASAPRDWREWQAKLDTINRRAADLERRLRDMGEPLPKPVTPERCEQRPGTPLPRTSRGRIRWVRVLAALAADEILVIPTEHRERVLRAATRSHLRIVARTSSIPAHFAILRIA